MLVFFSLDLFMSFLERLGFSALEFLCHFANQFPVQMVLGFCERDTFGSHELRGPWFTCLQRHFHCLHQRLSDMTHNLTSRSFSSDVESERLHRLLHDLDVILGLLQILLPFLFQFFVYRASNRSRVNFDAAEFSLQRLI